MDRGSVLKALRVPGRARPSIRRVSFLMFRADGVGGIARTAINLANQLAERHDVQIISLYQRRAHPVFDVDPRIQLTYLHDGRIPEGVTGHRGLWLPQHDPRQRVRGWLDRKPPRWFPVSMEEHVSTWTELLLLRKLKTLPPGVVISTRPSLHTLAARLAPLHLITIAQDHLNFENRAENDARMGTLLDSYRKMDCLTVLTEADAADYLRLLGDDTHVAAIPNAVPWAGTERSPLSSKTVIAGGRLVEQKGFHRLVAAYAPVAAAHPDWRLQIYGTGPLRADLRAQIDRLGVGDQVKLPGFTSEFPAKLADASVYAMTSIFEGFPMVLVEAMSKGLPLVSFDCPRGPSEIIDDGVNGYLVPDGDIGAFTRALLRIIVDDEGRRRMGAAALADVDKYSVGSIVARWERLLEFLIERRSTA